MEKVPFERVLGADVGSAIQALHESKGVVIKMARNLIEYQGEGGHITGVVVEGEGGREVLPADVCVVGAGVVPGTSYFKKSEADGLIKTARDGSVLVDEFLSPGPANVFVGGEIARYPYWLTGEAIRVEHWGMSHYHGKIAAQNMLKAGSQAVRSVPFFWTAQYGKSVRYAGHATSFEEVVVDGSLKDLNFTAYYVRAGKVVAVATINRDPVASLIAELMAVDKLPPLSELKGKSAEELQKLLK